MSADESKDSRFGWHTTDVTYYQKDLPEIDDSMRNLLEGYSGISPNDIASHLHEVRTRAWNIFPYPSIGNWHFLTLGIRTQPRYLEILARLRQGQTLLDLGCGFAQDLRHLVAAGAPAHSVYGIDVERPFIDLGHDLFLDRGKFPPGHFVAADVLDPESDAKALRGAIDIIYASQFFHLWGWDGQVEVGRAAVGLLNPARRSLIVGYQLGAVGAAEATNTPTKEGRMYLHNAASLQKLWDEVGAATGTRWAVEAGLDEAEIFGSYTKVDRSLQRLSFAIERVG